jgi:hypothetical protein
MLSLWNFYTFSLAGSPSGFRYEFNDEKTSDLR